MEMTRRQFLGMAIVTTAVAACGGDDGGGGGTDAPGRNCTMNGTTATISGNHGHTITVSAQDVAAGADKTYDITGTSDHTHMVTITAAQFAMLANNPNGSLMVTSTTGNAHTHGITILCA